MRTLPLPSLLCLPALAILLAGPTGPGPAHADDLSPPPWPRLGAANFSTSAEWEFLQPSSTPYPADGTEVPLIVGDGLGPALPEVLPGGSLTWDPWDGDGAYIGTGTDPTIIGALNFRIPNWIDQEPVKFMQVQITYAADPVLPPPSVIDIIPFDPSGFTSTQLLSVIDGPIPGDPNGRSHRVEMWAIYPNPDFESVTISVPTDVLVDQVVIDTISTVPEPASMMLLGLGGLTLLKRRRPGRRPAGP